MPSRSNQYFSSNCICDIWNALTDTVVVDSTMNAFKRLLNHVDLVNFFKGMFNFQYSSVFELSVSLLV